MRKPRSDSKLLNLPDEQKDEILGLMESGKSYKDLRELIAKEFGVRPSPSSLSHFYSQEKSKQLIQQRIQSLSVANAIRTDAEKNPAAFTPATIERLSQIAFELSIQPGADPKQVREFFKMVLEAGDQQLQRERLEFQKDQASKAKEAAGVASDNSLSAEEKERRMKQIFGAA